jgi:hypothetical protein
LREALEKLLQSSLRGATWQDKQVIAAWTAVHPEEALLFLSLGQCSPSLLANMLSIGLVLAGFQGDCKETTERMAQSKEHRYKMEAGMSSFSFALS